MKSINLSLAAVSLLGATALATSAFAAAPAAPAAGAPAAAAPAAPAITFDNMDAKVKTFADLKTIEGTENICVAADGSMFVTLINVSKLLKVSADGKMVSEFAAPKAANMLGVGCGKDPEVVVITFGKTFRGTPAVAATATTPAVPATPNNFADNDVHAWVYDLSGKQVADIPLAKGLGINGFDAAGGQVYYGGNSGKPEIVKLDTKAKTAITWFDAKDYAGPAPVPPAGPPIAVNGVRFANGWVYFRGIKPGSNPAVPGLYRIQVGADGKPMGAPAMMMEGLALDDFDVGPDGAAYFTSGTTLYKVATNGTQTKLADPVVGGPSMVVSNDGKTIYWPTRVAGTTTMQRILTIPLP